MNGIKILLSVIIVSALVSCSKPLPPKYAGFQNFRIEKVSLSNSVLATEIKIYNPNSYNLKLKSAVFDVYFNDALLGHSSFDSLLVLPSKDTALFPLRVTASAKDILSQSAKILLNPDVKIRLAGSAKAGRGGFYINVPIHYEGTQRIDLKSLLTSYNN